MKKTGIFTHPSQYLYTLALAALLFDAYYLVMKELPSVSGTKACVIGGALTTENLIFSGLISVLTAIILIGLFRLYRLKASLRQRAATGSFLSIGFIVGFFTVFCTLCTIPVISFFGLSIGLSFFTTYNLLFKLLSIFLMLLALFLLNGQLKNDCKRCRY